MREYLSDLKVVARPLWFLLLLQAFIVVAFLFIPQGPDVLFSVIENYSALMRGDNVAWKYINSLPLFTIIIALCYWCLAAEYCCRLLLQSADLSSTQIGNERVKRRRTLSRAFPVLLYFFPLATLIVAFAKACIEKRPAMDGPNILTLAITEGLLVFLTWSLYHLRYGRYKWVFMPPESYTRIKEKLEKLSFWYHRYFKYFVISSSIIIITFAFAPIGMYRAIGATAFICLGFASWTVIYTLIEILHKVQYFPLQLPYKTIILLVLLVSSYVNKDHPVRTLPQKGDYAQRLLPQEHFNRWLAKREAQQTDSIIPVIFIAAEGGALRTGCFTSMMLAGLQDSFPRFKGNIYCYSSVSGGSLGVQVFNAMTLMRDDTVTYKTRVMDFYQYDFLAPVTAKLVFGEAFNWISPWFLPAADRAGILEQSWEEAWRQMSRSHKDTFNYLSMDWDSYIKRGVEVPAVLINSTEAESGNRAIISNLQMDTPYFRKTVDWISLAGNNHIRFSTAIGLSARFPLISPAGALETQPDKVRKHFIDGGYFENKGDASLYELLKMCLQPAQRHYRIKPYVIQLSFDEDTTVNSQSVTWMNELMEPLSGILNIRSGHTRYANEVLKEYVQQSGGYYIEFKVGYRKNEIPMNWTLSGYALKKIQERCKLLMTDYYRNPALASLYHDIQ